ncbi:MAG: imidazole glycerol phosphate synthase subunit HisH, partial [Myxococcota bacterium]
MSDARSITVLDLGLGNLHSVLGALRRVGASPRVGSSAEDIANAERLLVPGQGGFAAGARALTPVRREALRSHLDSGRPYLGICLGMQLLFEGSEEAPGAEGLGYFAGRCVRFDETRAPRIPHMAWTPIDGDHPFVEAGAYFYFVHSYHCVPDDAALTVARAD